ncbi:hypothetical protein V8G54_002718 [Vigna mungo]|uniref:Uncharacterized protein n=1 Tax=Vigna mungo TaxID=3915 RepID=A0AAQ3S9H4_VIGMU
MTPKPTTIRSKALVYITAAAINGIRATLLVYFVSKTLQDVETMYQMVENVMLFIATIMRRLMPYFQSHIVFFKTNYLLQKFDLNLTSELQGIQILEDEWWTLYVDGFFNPKGVGTIIIFERANDVLIENSLQFNFKTSNNQTKYEVIIANLTLVREVGTN